MRGLKGHGHWVNTLALSTEYALRTGAYDHTATAPTDLDEAKAKALARHALFLFMTSLPPLPAACPRHNTIIGA